MKRIKIKNHLKIKIKKEREGDNHIRENLKILKQFILFYTVYFILSLFQFILFYLSQFILFQNTKILILFYFKI